MPDLTMLVKKVGRKNSNSPTQDEIDQMKVLLNDGNTVTSVAKAFGRSKNTVYKYTNQ